MSFVLCEEGRGRAARRPGAPGGCGRYREEDDHASSESPEPTAIDACFRSSLGVGELGALPGAERHDDADEEHFTLRKGPRVGGALGYSIHAGVTVAAWDRDGRERLCRYCARPAFALERLSLLPDGRVAYELKHPRKRDATHRIMTPLQFMARIAALIPPPRHPLLKLHGVLAPKSAHRAKVVPASPAGRAAEQRATASRCKVPKRPRTEERVRSAGRATGLAAPQAPPAVAAAAPDAAR